MTRVALITGATGGIGRAMVDRFASAGYIVVASDLRADSGQWSRFLQADLADPSTADYLAGSVAAVEGGLDVLVNNAALQIVGAATTTSIADWDRLMAVNLRAPFLLACRSHDLLRSRRGAVVNVASVHACATSSGLAAYAASKGGVAALTRALALEWAADGIRVNAVLPGAVETPMLAAGLVRDPLAQGDVAEARDRLARRTPLARLGAGTEIAEAALFLADGRRSGYVTGQSLVVDGGALAHLSTE